MRFNDEAHIRAYIEKGEFPAIHQDIAAVIRLCASEAEPCFDLGAGFSLLSAQAVEIGRSLCVSIEGNDSNSERAIIHPKVIKEQLLIDYGTLPVVESLLKTHRPTLIIARRVFPELTVDGTSKLVETLGELFWENGVQKIILEGRIVVANATNILPSANHEALALRKHYQVENSYKNVRYLARKNAI